MNTETLAAPVHKPKPKWLRVKLPTGKKYTELRSLVDKYDLHTICTSGSCPNMGECWSEGTATFMILGNVCTRSCGFCGVKTGRPETVDWDEPEKGYASSMVGGLFVSLIFFIPVFLVLLAVIIFSIIFSDESIFTVQNLLKLVFVIIVLDAMRNSGSK